MAKRVREQIDYGNRPERMDPNLERKLSDPESLYGKNPAMKKGAADVERLVSSRFKKVADKLKQSHPDWTFHLVGKDFEDDYSKQVKLSIINKHLEDSVFVYGSKNDIKNIINQSDITVLTSKSEGLPIALIEYGLSKKPVVSTKVGEISLIIKDGINGFIVDANDASLFYQKVVRFITESDLRAQMGDSLYQTVIENNSEEGIIVNYLNWVTSL